MNTRRLVAFCLAAATVTGLAASATPSAAGADTAPKRHRLAAGVSVWHDWYQVTNDRKVRLSLMRVDLTARGVRIDADSPDHMIGRPRQSTLTTATANGAIGGINGDFFNWRTDDAVPVGGLVRAGRVLKTPRGSREANFSIRKDGRATIGRLDYVAAVTRPADDDRAMKTRRIASVNTLDDAYAGRVTLINSAMTGFDLHRGCVIAAGTVSHGHRVVTTVIDTLTHLKRRTGNGFALMACRSSSAQGAKWLSDNLNPGDRVALTGGFTQGTPKAAVSGSAVLVRNGRAYDDETRRLDGGSWEPQTFACIRSSGRQVLFGTVDGRVTRSRGLDFDELTRYLVRIGCTTAMTFDGGGSSTMVARFPGRRTLSVLNTPSDGQPRKVPDGLFVYSH